MHYNRKYDNPDPVENKKQALADIKNWLGAKKFNQFESDVKLLLQSPVTAPSRVEFEFACSIGGVEGYPVEVWADHLGVPAHPDNRTDES